MNNFTLKVPSINYQKTISLKVVCGCKKSKPAKNFKQLVALVKQAEEILIKNGHEDMEDRIHILRGIYYGTEWSVDYKSEKSSMRNFAFNFPYTNSFEPKDARKELKCFKDCKAELYNSLFESYEVFDSKYKAVDFGHLIIGLDARRSWRASNFHIPTQGGTGLEICTWVGDLGGGVGNLATKRVNNPKIRAKTLFPVHCHSSMSLS